MKNSWKWLLALAISCLSFACTLEPNEPADLEAQLLAEVADPIAEVEPMALEPTEPLAASPDEEILTTRCCQVWLFESAQAEVCETMTSAKWWAKTRCAALSAHIPFTYPKLVSGPCGNYRPGICPT